MATKNMDPKTGTCEKMATQIVERNLSLYD
jgi:hypothetical protein